MDALRRIVGILGFSVGACGQCEGSRGVSAGIHAVWVGPCAQPEGAYEWLVGAYGMAVGDHESEVDAPA